MNGVKIHYIFITKRKYKSQKIVKKTISLNYYLLNIQTIKKNKKKYCRDK